MSEQGHSYQLADDQGLSTEGVGQPQLRAHRVPGAVCMAGLGLKICSGTEDIGKLPYVVQLGQEYVDTSFIVKVESTGRSLSPLFNQSDGTIAANSAVTLISDVIGNVSAGLFEC